MKTELILKIDKSLPYFSRKILMGFQVDDIPIGDLMTIENFLLLANDMTINAYTAGFGYRHTIQMNLQKESSGLILYLSYDKAGLNPFKLFIPIQSDDLTTSSELLLFKSLYINNSFKNSR